MDFRVWDKLPVNSERKREGSRRELPQHSLCGFDIQFNPMLLMGR